MLRILPAISAAALAAPLDATAQRLAPVAAATSDISDEALVRTLPGFRNGYATADGVRLHYVTGGDGPLLILLLVGRNLVVLPQDDARSGQGV
jgi:hypothetical protein